MRSRPYWWPDGLVAAVAAFAILGPLLVRRGYALHGDMVFVPDQPWKGAWLGLDGRIPRFVPGDAFVWAAGALLPGDIVQKVILFGALLVGGVGAGRVVARRSGLGRSAAIVLFLWNPWIYERLAIGQWGVVVGYALLPWVVLAAARVRDAESGAWASLTLWLALSAVFSPASGLVSVGTALAVVAVGGTSRAIVSSLGMGLAVNLPWIVPSALSAGSVSASGHQFVAFAARGETPLGVVASLASFGGIWKTSIVPPERSSMVIVALSCVLTVVAVLGLRRALRDQRRLVIGLAVAGAATVTIALFTAIPAVARAMDHAAGGLPPLGILRDTHRYLAPALLALVVGVAAATDWLVEQARPGRGGLRVLAVLVLVAPVLCLPSLAWGLHGRLHPVGYPREWFVVRDEVPAGRMVVLPWRGGYRGFAWNGPHAVLDPSPRFFPGDVLIDDRVYLDGGDLQSEDPLLRAVTRALASADPAKGLTRLGVRSVLVEKDNLPNASDGAATVTGRVLHDGPGLRLVDLGKPSGTAPFSGSQTRSVVVVAVDLLVLLLCGVAAVCRVRRSRRPPCMVR